MRLTPKTRYPRPKPRYPIPNLRLLRARGDTAVWERINRQVEHSYRVQ